MLNSNIYWNTSLFKLQFNLWIYKKNSQTSNSFLVKKNMRDNLLCSLPRKIRVFLVFRDSSKENSNWNRKKCLCLRNVSSKRKFKIGILIIKKDKEESNLDWSAKIIIIRYYILISPTTLIYQEQIHHPIFFFFYALNKLLSITLIIKIVIWSIINWETLLAERFTVWDRLSKCNWYHFPVNMTLPLSQLLLPL